MKSDKNVFYITTAIDYPNSVPHMGHAYEKILADFYARAYRLRGVNTYFLIGLDEHGQKIQEAAQQSGMSPQDFVDEKARAFLDLYKLLDISNDDFIRTSEARHHQFAQEIYTKVYDNGDIYKDFYEADYCISCERAYTKSELNDGKCPVHDRETSTIREESYFFRLGKYRDAVREHIEAHSDFVYPPERRNEILARLGEEVHDLSISRSTFAWGVPVPNDPDHVLYVWFDALSNYISAIQRPNDLMSRYWPASCHVIGKDILWFHTCIWPAMLLSAGYKLPKQVYAHGFILDKDGRKMAKHLGNVTDPLEVVRDYSVDVLRYYFLRSFSSGQDGKFSMEDLDERYHSDLGNDLGNLVLRISKLIQTRLEGTIDTPGYPVELDPKDTITEYVRLVDGREVHRAVETLWTYIRSTNAYLNEKEPWKLQDEGEFAATLGCALEALRVIAHLLFPVMPQAAQEIAATIGTELTSMSALSSGPGSYRVTLGKPLFPRRDQPPVKSEAAPGSAKAKKEANQVDPFAKLEIRVAQIESVEAHPDAEKLWVMTVRVGDETRTICAGLREHVPAEELQNRKVVVLANLKPAKFRGVESRGMVLAADTADGRVVPVDPGAAELGDLVQVEGIEPRPKKKLSMSEFQKAPLALQDGRVTYSGRPLKTSVGEVTCDGQDGSTVR